MESQSSGMYEDCVSKIESEKDENNQKRIDIKKRNNYYEDSNDDNVNIYFKSGDNFKESLNKIKSDNNDTKFDNNEVQKSCCQENKCQIY